MMIHPTFNFFCLVIGLTAAPYLAGDSIIGTHRPVPTTLPARLVGVWEGNLIPPGDFPDPVKGSSSKMSVITFHPYHSAYSDEDLRFDMTTRWPRLVCNSYGDYIYRNGVLLLHFGSSSKRDNPAGWWQYTVTQVGDKLQLNLLNSSYANDPSHSATIRRMLKAKQIPLGL